MQMEWSKINPSKVIVWWYELLKYGRPHLNVVFQEIDEMHFSSMMFIMEDQSHRATSVWQGEVPKQKQPSTMTCRCLSTKLAPFKVLTQRETNSKWLEKKEIVEEERIQLLGNCWPRASSLAKIFTKNSQVYRQMKDKCSPQHCHVNTLLHKQTQLWFLTECPVWSCLPQAKWTAHISPHLCWEMLKAEIEEKNTHSF